MAIWIQISPGSNRPIYQQITEQIEQAIAQGQLQPGEKLPTVRKLASELVINPNTAARAYSVLEQAGLVVTKTGTGTFVGDPKLRLRNAVDMSIFAERMDSLITRGLNLGIGRDDLINMFNNRVNTFVKRFSARDKNE